MNVLNPVANSTSLARERYPCWPVANHTLARKPGFYFTCWPFYNGALTAAAVSGPEREAKWQQRWADAHIFEAEPNPQQEKYFVNFPYPYVNGYPHLGHGFTLLRAEMMARYQRMRGRNVLWPFAFHCTGTPIAAAAQRVAEQEPSQLRALEQMGITGKLAKSLAEPQAWFEHFPERFQQDLQSLGLAVDWRRSFITTDQNPAYDTFIRWQFNRLREGNYLRKGSFPVVWCPERETVVGDHDRISGEGETPQEYCLLKFRGDAGTLVAATLRPETVFGQTNLWVDGSGTYARVRVDGEEWICSEQMPDKLQLQGHEVEELGTIAGSELIGQRYAPPGIDRELIVLPADFCDATIGSGIVTSVPSDAPDDWQGLADLQESVELCAEWNLDHKYIKKIEPLAIIDSGELGTVPAPALCRQMGVRDQHDRARLEEAKQQLYLHSFQHGTMLDSIGMNCAGLPVDVAREKVRATLIASGDALRYYELTGPARSRWLTDCTVKIVEDQWFLKYDDSDWTARTRKALDSMELFPKKARTQFEYVLDWLRDWACAREHGLGTRLPWDDKWVIESLSDSTIYMAYYTVAHHVNSLPVEKLSEELFEALFGNGDLAAVPNIDAEQVAAWRDEFEYWYPYDLRVSGKDLIQNHLSFSLFNHTAVFPPAKWPRGFAVNGWVLVDGEKMSKSRGNFYTIRQLIDRYGADTTRLTLCNSGEGLDDPNWEGSFADTAGRKLERWLRFVTENAGGGRDEPHPVDDWFAATLSQAVHDAGRACDRMRFRTAMRHLFFELPHHYRWYLRRCGEPHRELLHDYLSTVTRGLAPIVPHLAEEAWEVLDGDGFVSTASYPDGKPASDKLLRGEALIQRTHADIEAILKVAHIESPQTITLLVTPDWKWQAVGIAAELADERGRVEMQHLMKMAMSALPAEARKEAASFLKQWTLKEIPTLGPGWAARYMEQLNETIVLEQAADFLADAFDCRVIIAAAGDAKDEAASKARQAAPLRPAIFVK